MGSTTALWPLPKTTTAYVAIEKNRLLAKITDLVASDFAVPDKHSQEISNTVNRIGDLVENCLDLKSINMQLY